MYILGYMVVHEHVHIGQNLYMYVCVHSSQIRTPLLLDSPWAIKQYHVLHVHVHVGLLLHIHMYMYMYMYIQYHTCTRAHIHVHHFTTADIVSTADIRVHNELF